MNYVHRSLDCEEGVEAGSNSNAIRSGRYSSSNIPIKSSLKFSIFVRNSNIQSSRKNKAARSRNTFANFPAKGSGGKGGLRKFTTKTFTNSINEGKTLRIVSRVIRP